MNNDNEISVIIDNFLRQEKFQNLSDQEKTQKKNEMELEFNLKYYLGLFENIDESFHQELKSLIEKGDEEELNNFLIVNMNNYFDYKYKVISEFVDNLSKEFLK